MNKYSEIQNREQLNELLPDECIKKCSDLLNKTNSYLHAKEWAEKLELNIPREKCFEILEQFGGWSEDMIGHESDKELNAKVLWVSSELRENL